MTARKSNCETNNRKKMGQTTLTLSKAELSDLNEILELQKEAYIQEARIYNNFEIQPLTQKLDSLAAEWRNGIVIKAETNGQIVGSVRAQLVDHVCKIGKLIVKPDFQNQGIGKKLMSEIEKAFDNCSVYELFTGNKSIKNLAIYRKLGYTDCREEQADNSLKLIYLQKQNER
jgi:ribosomal protein S18 acetylase RimI-like enzyme